MKVYEKESLRKSFLLFFFSLEVLVGIIFSFYYTIQQHALDTEVFQDLKNYNYTLEGDHYPIDFIERTTDTLPYQLYLTEDEVFSFFTIPGDQNYLLKISYPEMRYVEKKSALLDETLLYFLFSSMVIALYALFFSFYTLSPLQKAYLLLEEFLKDVIHDLNTPVTSILVNAKLLRKSVQERFIERIELSAKTIHTLHENLQNYLHNIPLHFETVDVTALVEERLQYHRSLYTRLTFVVNLEPCRLETNRNAFQRIIDNILSNACKYNTADGSVTVTLTQEALTIEDTGVGIKNTRKVFERFYKESSRGIGIGLHIVEKLSEELGIHITLTSSKDGTIFTLKWNKTT